MGPRWYASFFAIMVMFVLAWINDPISPRATTVSIVEQVGVLAIIGGIPTVIVSSLLGLVPEMKAWRIVRWVATAVLALYLWAVGWFTSFWTGDLLCGAETTASCETTTTSRLVGVTMVTALWLAAALAEGKVARYWNASARRDKRME